MSRHEAAAGACRSTSNMVLLALLAKRRWRMDVVTIDQARALWEPVGVYCNTASYGLPPRPAWDALQAALDDWHGGRTSWEHWGESTEGARASFARLVGVDVERVA